GDAAMPPSATTLHSPPSPSTPPTHARYGPPLGGHPERPPVPSNDDTIIIPAVRPPRADHTEARIPGAHRSPSSAMPSTHPPSRPAGPPQPPSNLPSRPKPSAEGEDGDDEVDEEGEALAAVHEIWPTFSGQPIAGQPYTAPAQPQTSKTRLNEKYTFDTFVIGASNSFAHAAAVAVAEAPSRAYTPLFVWGESGLGKTHLLHAVGHYAQRLFRGMRVRYVSTEEFTNDFINSLRDDRKVAFQRRYRDIDILLVDDIQFLEGKEGTQEEFFHTFNTLHNANKQIVVSSDRPPKRLETLED